MNSSLNQKLAELRAELEEGGATPQYTKVIKPSGSAKALPTAAIKAGETPEYGDEGEEMDTDEPKSAKASPISTKVSKATSPAKALPTPAQSKPPSSKPGGLAGEDFRRLSGLPRLNEEENAKARELLREAEKQLKQTISTFKALAKAEPGLKDIIETYTVPHLTDWVSGQTTGSVRMLWADLRDVEKNYED